MTNDTHETNTHREVFPTEKAAQRFTVLSQTTPTIPTTLSRNYEVCNVESVSIDFANKTRQEQYSLFCDYITALQKGILHGFYHLDIKPSHFGNSDKSGVLLDWGDAYCINESSVFFFTIQPTNMETLFDNPTHKSLTQAIISQVGQVLYDMEMIETNHIHTSPHEYSLEDIKSQLQNKSN